MKLKNGSAFSLKQVIDGYPDFKPASLLETSVAKHANQQPLPFSMPGRVITGGPGMLV